MPRPVLAVLCLLLVVIATTSTHRAMAEAVVYEIEARIDGRDFLYVRADTLQWYHQDFAAVGRHEGINEPTIISSWLNGVQQMDHVAWIPDWPEPPPAEIRYPAWSSVFSGLTPSLPQADRTV